MSSQRTRQRDVDGGKKSKNKTAKVKLIHYKDNNCKNKIHNLTTKWLPKNKCVKEGNKYVKFIKINKSFTIPQHFANNKCKNNLYFGNHYVSKSPSKMVKLKYNKCYKSVAGKAKTFTLKYKKPKSYKLRNTRKKFKKHKKRKTRKNNRKYKNKQTKKR